MGKASQQLDLLDPVSRFCGETLTANSIYVFLHEHRDRLFPDRLFTDLFARVGRKSVPPSVVAAVMILQRLEGLSDREAVDRFALDVRWRYAAAASLPATLSHSEFGTASIARAWSTALLTLATSPVSSAHCSCSEPSAGVE